MSKFYMKPAGQMDVAPAPPQRITSGDAEAVAHSLAEVVPRKLEPPTESGGKPRIPITQGTHGEHGKFAYSEQDRDADGDSWKIVRRLVSSSPRSCCQSVAQAH